MSTHVTQALTHVTQTSTHVNTNIDTCQHM